MNNLKFTQAICYLALVGVLLLSSSIETSLVLGQRPLSSMSVANNNQTNSATTLSSTGNLSKLTLLPYQSRTNGLFMLYPSDWTASISGLLYPEVIKFYSPLQNASDFLPAHVSISVTKYVKNITLVEYTKIILSSLKPTSINGSSQIPQINIKNVNAISISGNPGYRVLFSIVAPANRTSVFDIMETWTVVGNKLYFISYSAQPSKFIKYLPDVDRMISSIRIAKT